MRILELEPVQKERYGRISKNGVDLKPHEDDTIIFLAEHGFNIEAIVPSYIPKNKNPDILVNGATWEMKSPEGNGKYTIQRQFSEAGHQAHKLIIDLRRTKIPAQKAERDSIFHFSKSSRIRELMIITKDNRLLDIKK